MAGPKSGNLRAYCQELASRMENTWQRIPELAGAPPIALEAELSCHEGYGQLDPRLTREFPSVPEALRAALAKAKPPVVVLFAPPGAGKSTALKKTTREQALRVRDEGIPEENPCPVYVDLEQPTGSKDPPKSLDDILKECRPPEAGVDGPILWLIDGLDQLPQEKEALSASSVLARARRLACSAQKFVFSTRSEMPSVETTLGAWGRHWRITLLPLACDVREDWVRKHWPPEVVDNLTDFERLNPQASDFLDVPLLLGIAVFLCKTSTPAELNYPGFAGFFDRFVTRMLQRAVTEKEQTDFEGHLLEVVERVFWTALVLDGRRSIPKGQVKSLLKRAYGEGDIGVHYADWEEATRILAESDLLRNLAGISAWAPLHQLFAEHWAARHMATRLADAAKDGRFELELWECLKNKQLDAVAGQALAIMSAEAETLKLMHSAFDFLEAISVSDMLKLAAATGTSVGHDRVKQALRSSDEGTRVAAISAVARCRGKWRIDALVGLLSDPSPAIRGAAAFELREIKAKLPLETAASLLEDPSVGVRVNAALLFGELAVGGVNEQLMERIRCFLKSGTRWKPIAAKIALGKAATDRDSASSLLDDEDPEVRSAVVDILECRESQDAPLNEAESELAEKLGPMMDEFFGKAEKGDAQMRSEPPALRDKLAEQRQRRNGLRPQAEAPEEDKKNTRAPIRVPRKTKACFVGTHAEKCGAVITEDGIRITRPGVSAVDVHLEKRLVAILGTALVNSLPQQEPGVRKAAFLRITHDGIREALNDPGRTRGQNKKDVSLIRNAVVFSDERFLIGDFDRNENCWKSAIPFSLSSPVFSKDLPLSLEPEARESQDAEE